jgi:delta-aminolevulinic acid dehydratase/porphobilinogen synthase
MVDERFVVYDENNTILHAQHFTNFPIINYSVKLASAYWNDLNVYKGVSTSH